MRQDADSPFGLFERLLEVLLPQGGFVMSLHEAYFDESGCDDGSRLLSVGGYLIRTDSARIMDREWRKMLDKYEVPFLHMKDVAPGNEPFDHLKKWQRVRLVKRAIKLIKSYTSIGIVAIVNPRRFEERHGVSDPYTYCVNIVLIAMAAWLDGTTRKQETGKIALFVERGHQNGNKADAEIRRWSENEDGQQFYAAHSFVGKQDAPIIQAADLLVWQSAKFMKDKLFGTRPPRKDFLSLMRHPHAFAYIVLYQRHFGHSVDNTPHIEDPFRDGYLNAVFSDTDTSNDIVNQYHDIMERRAKSGIISV